VLLSHFFRGTATGTVFMTIVTLLNRSISKRRLKLQATRAFRFTCKHIRVNITNYISRAMGLRKVSNSKSKLQGNSRSLDWCHSLIQVPFPISLPLLLCLYLARFRDSVISTNLKKSGDPEHLPFGVLYHPHTSAPQYQ